VLIEQQVLNVTRDQIGGWLLESWNLPAEVSSAIRQQQLAAPEGDAEVYALLLRLTTRLLRREGLADGPVLPIDDALLSALGLTMAEAEAALESLCAASDDLNELTHTLTRARAQAS
jgi:HD-like signal output (HDOD) protein